MPTRSCVLIACAATALPLSAMAQDDDIAWDKGITIVPYGWIAGVTGTIGSDSADVDPGGDLELPERVDVTVDNELEEIGFMFYGEWRGEHWLAFFDSVWVNVGQDGTISVADVLPSSDAHAGIDGNVYQAAVGYRMFADASTTLAFYGGARYYDIDAEAWFEGGLLPQRVTVTTGETWADVVLGARLGFEFSDKWHALLLMDAGFGESDSSWQMFGSVSYRLTDWGSVVGGFRYMSLDYSTDQYRVDLNMSGPVIGFAFRF